MQTASSWAVRGLLGLACVLLTARSIHVAVADMRAQQAPDGLARALRLEPGDSVLLARAALARNAAGDMSKPADEQLLKASEADPLNSDLPMALGLREEFRGNNAAAEQYLTHAAEIDHTFKPAWTLANYYFRTNQLEKMWPMVRRCLRLDPLGFDPRPVFDLAWNASSDSKMILGLMPAQGTVPLQYLVWLMSTKRTEAAIESWPVALGAADPANHYEIDLLTGFTDFLLQANRTQAAVKVWNQLVERKMVNSLRLDPAAGVSVADPEFSFPLIEKGFGWRVAHEPGLSIAKGSAGLRFEFDGNQPESSTILSVAAPLVPGRAYRLVWKTDASRLSSKRDAGFVWQIVQQPGDTMVACEPLLHAGDDGSCQFLSVPKGGNARVDLLYRRALGTTRVDGMLRILSVRLEFGS